MIDFLYLAFAVIITVIIWIVSSHSQNKEFKKVKFQNEVILRSLEKSKLINLTKDEKGNVTGILVDTEKISIDASAEIRIEAEVLRLCSECGERFVAVDGEKTCPKCQEKI